MKSQRIKKTILYSLPLVLLAVLVILGYRALTKPSVTVIGAPETLAAVPDFSLDGLADDDLPGEPALVNFFASWCAPCEAEHPLITDLAQTYPVYGIAFLDEPEKTREFLKRLGNPFAQVGHDTEGVAAAEWGIVGVPTSFVTDGDHILYRHDGPLTEKIITQDIAPRLKGKEME